MEGVAKGRIGDWGEVVTRYPYENVGMDHLLSMEKELRTLLINVLLSFERILSLNICSLKTR